MAPGFEVNADLYRGFGVKGGMETALFARNVIAATPWFVGIFYDFDGFDGPVPAASASYSSAASSRDS